MVPRRKRTHSREEDSHGGFKLRRRQQGRSSGGRQRAHQAAKELSTRFDFRGTDTTIEWQGEEGIILTSSTEERVKAAVDVFKEKLIRRDISMKAFDAGDPQPSGKTYKVIGSIKQGIDSENAKKITKLIRDEGPKGVKAQIQGEEIRVSSRSATTCRPFRRCCVGRPRGRAAVRQPTARRRRLSG